MMNLSKKIQSLPPYLFAEIDRKIDEKRKMGADVISFGIGDPDLPTPEHIVEAGRNAITKAENHRYPSHKGMIEFREAVALRYKRDYRLTIDAEEEAIALIGSKEGIHNIHFALIDPGDVVLHTSPCYPVYLTGPLFAGGKSYSMPLKKENDFKPDLEAVPSDVVKKTKMMWINYPNNPTAAVADKSFYREVVDFASDNQIVVCSDEAYSCIVFDGYKSPCFLEVNGAREVGIVFDSLSKTYRMTGWRLGYAVGDSRLVGGLAKVKANVDSGASQIIQEAGIAALTGPQDCVDESIKIYQERRDMMVQRLNKLGLKCEKPKATFYLWIEVPDGDSRSFADRLLEEAMIVVTPGIGFGPEGEGYVRMALTQPVSRINEALERMEKIL
ncbi:MAG: LL-diaminopimelate aminotransferase [Candidatus Hydrothermarchaeales archaeon]